MREIIHNAKSDLCNLVCNYNLSPVMFLFLFLSIFPLGIS